MIDADLKPWLIEINSSPDFSYSTPVTEALVRRVSEDTCKVVIDYAAWEAAKTAARVEARAAAKRAAAAASGAAAAAPPPPTFRRGTKPFTVVSARGARCAAELVVAVPSGPPPGAVDTSAAAEGSGEPGEEALVTAYPYVPPRSDGSSSAPAVESPVKVGSDVPASMPAPVAALTFPPPPDTGGWTCIFKSTVVAGSLTCTAHDIMVFGSALRRPVAPASASAPAKKMALAAQRKVPAPPAAESRSATALPAEPQLSGRVDGRSSRESEEEKEGKEEEEAGPASSSADVEEVLAAPSSEAVATARSSRIPRHVGHARGSAAPQLQPSARLLPSAPVGGTGKAVLKLGVADFSLGSLPLRDDGAGASLMDRSERSSASGAKGGANASARASSGEPGVRRSLSRPRAPSTGNGHPRVAGGVSAEAAAT